MLALFKQCSSSTHWKEEPFNEECVVSRQYDDVPTAVKVGASKEAARRGTFGSDATRSTWDGETFDGLEGFEDDDFDGDFDSEELPLPCAQGVHRAEQGWGAKFLPKEVVIFIDWDDTLCPTTWLESKPLFNSWWKNRTAASNVLSEREWAELQALDAAARAAVLAASQQGQVVCVTLATRGWHLRTMETFMPLLAEEWRRLEIKTYYASSEKLEQKIVAPGGWVPRAADEREAEQLAFQLRAQQKSVCMKKALRKHYGRGASYSNVISIGDGAYEQCALQEIGYRHVPTHRGDLQLVKTLKLKEQPGCSELASALQALQAFMPAMVACEDDLDIDLGAREARPSLKSSFKSAALPSSILQRLNDHLSRSI